MPVWHSNRTITQLSVSTTAGTLDLVAAQAGQKIYVVGFVLCLDAAGTLQFTEGTGPTALTGAFELLADSPFGVHGDGMNPVLQTNTAGAKLSLVTATGNPRGYIRYFVAP